MHIGHSKLYTELQERIEGRNFMRKQRVFNKIALIIVGIIIVYLLIA